MEFAVLGWPPDGPTLELDYRQFSYAGKFVTPRTGKAVAREDGEIVAAVCFNDDRTDDETLWLRYVTVRTDRRGEGIAPRLIARVVAVARDRGYESIKIAVNNPFAYRALYRAGFGYTGEQTGLAELVLAFPGDRSTGAYRTGLDVFRARDDMSDEERSFLEAKRESGPPSVLARVAERRSHW